MIPLSPTDIGTISSLDRRELLRGLAVAGSLSGLAGPVWAAAGETAATGGRTRIIHGVTLTDPFGWLDDAALDDPQVIRLRAEFDAAAHQVMTRLEALTRRLRAEADAASPLPSDPTPVPDGAYGYWSDWSQGRRQLWRIHLASGARQLLLDAAETDADGKAIGNVVAWGISPDDATLAFATVAVPEHHDIRFKHIATGQLRTEVVRDVGVQITSERLVWTADGRGIVYGEVDASGRPWRARIHWLGRPQVGAPIIHEETDPGFFIEIRQTSSGRFAVIHSSSVDTTEARLVDRENTDSVRLVSARRAGRLYAVDHGGGDALDILTNDTHPNFRLVNAPLGQPDRWSELVPAQDRTGLAWHQAFHRHLVVAERHEGNSRVRVFDRASATWRIVDIPEPVAVVGFDRWTAGPEANREPEPAQLRLGVETFAQPKALYEYSFAEGALKKLQAGTAASGLYLAERLQATSPDGTIIPMSMIRPRTGPLHGAVLYGYGAYGVPSDPDFDTQRFSLLTRGVAYVIAHVRGGGDLGGAWHDAGRGAARGKPVDDFIACAQALVAQGIVPPGKIVSTGRSAGGWLVGAALNRAPDVWAGVMADVPYVDVLNALLDPERPLSATETSEVGDVIQDPAAFARVLRLCAYQNVPARKLPPVYLTASLADVRIPWSGVLKYVARLRAAHPDNAVALRLDRDGNHWGPADRETRDLWRAERVAFALNALDLV
jgi:oligopeptidase B